MIDVVVVETLVARQKQLNAALDGIKAQAAEHEQAIEKLYESGEPIAREAKSVSRELRIALGFDQPQQTVAVMEQEAQDAGLAPEAGGCAGNPQQAQA